MGEDIGQIYKHSPSQLSISSTKASVSSSLESQTSYAVKLTTTSIPYIIDKHQDNSVLCYRNTIQNDATITNNADIQSCVTYQQFQHLIIIHNVFLPHYQVH